MLFDDEDLPRFLPPDAEVRGRPEAANHLCDWGEVFAQLRIMEEGFHAVRTDFGSSRSDLFWLMPRARPLRVQVKASSRPKAPGPRSTLPLYQFPTDIVAGEFDVAVFIAKDIGASAWMFGHEVAGTVTFAQPGTPHTPKTKYGNIDQFPISRIIEGYDAATDE